MTDVEHHQESLLAEAYTLAALQNMEFPPLVEFVPGLVTEGAGMLVGGPKLGKSWMALNFALGIGYGGTVLNSINVAQRDVLYLALEDGQRRVQSRVNKLMAGSDEPWPETVTILNVITKGQVLATIREWYEQHPGGLAILDTLAKNRPQGQPGNSAYLEDYVFGSALKRAVDDHPGSALLCVHHDRKLKGNDFVDNISGTNGLAGAMDYVLVLSRSRHSGEATLSVTGRDISEAEYALTTDDGIWRLEGATLADASDAARSRRDAGNLGDRSNEVLEFVNGRPLGTRAKDLASHLGIDDNVAGNYLRRLNESGRITKRTRGVYTPLVEVVEVVETSETAGQGSGQQDLLSTTSTTVVETGEPPSTRENTTSTTSTTTFDLEVTE